MLASVAEAAHAAGLSVENVHTSLKRKGNAVHFVLDMDCVTTQFMDHEEIRDMVHNLSLLKQRLDLDICDVRVQRMASAARNT